jgi:hypothetical protein
LVTATRRTANSEVLTPRCHAFDGTIDRSKCEFRVGSIIQ